jgi:hypothetical protein
MIINTKIFNQTVETAKAKSANNPAMLRAIDRAVVEINKSKYWAYDSQANVLKLMSTTSKKLYVIDDQHTCDAHSKHCKHLVARRLMQRYAEALGVAAVEGERAVPPAPMAWSAAGEQTANGWKARDEEALSIFPAKMLDFDKPSPFLGRRRGEARKQRYDWRREF